MPRSSFEGGGMIPARDSAGFHTNWSNDDATTCFPWVRGSSPCQRNNRRTVCSPEILPSSPIHGSVYGRGGDSHIACSLRRRTAGGGPAGCALCRSVRLVVVGCA